MTDYTQEELAEIISQPRRGADYRCIRSIKPEGALYQRRTTQGWSWGSMPNMMYKPSNAKIKVQLWAFPDGMYLMRKTPIIQDGVCVQVGTLEELWPVFHDYARML